MKRIQKPRKIKDTILILTNGKTEKKYFDNITKEFKTMFSIKVEFKNKQCDELVRYAIALERTNYNQIWCVFDIDDTYEEGHLISALELAKHNDINVTYSNESFEVWLLYHLTNKVSTGLRRKTYIKEINNLLQSIGINCKYQKNNEELLKKVFIPQILIATQNSKKMHQKLEAEHQKDYLGNTNYPVWLWKSSTTIYKLIESLQLSERETDN